MGNKIYIFLILLICPNVNLFAQEVVVDNSNFSYQISPVYDFKQSILSLTFDDGSLNQFHVALPLLKERGVPATFYLITSLVDSMTKNIIYNGISKDYEIGSHTVTHKNLCKIGNDEVETELFNSKSFLQKHFGLNSGLTMSYPWGFYNGSVKDVVKKVYLASRSTNIGYNSLFTLDRYALKMQGFGEHVRAETANLWISFAIENRLWLIEMFHGIDNVGFSPITSDVLIEHLDYIKKVEDRIWCSTVSNVIKYIDESKKAKIECDFCNDTIYKIRINDFMDDSLYNQLLSIRIKVPANWDSIWISNSAKIKTEYFNKNKFILFNALPDNQLITIRPELIYGPLVESGIRLVYLSANPFNDKINMALEVFDESDIDILMYDMNGKSIIHQTEKSVNGVINLLFDTSGISKGMYFLRVSISSGEYLIRKIVKI